MQPNVKPIVTLLMLNLALIINSANPVSFTYDYNVERKCEGIAGSILIDLISDSLLDSILCQTARFQVNLTVNNKGDIISILNKSRGISDKIISEFVEALKKNKTELYIYILTPPSIPKNKQEYINSTKQYKFPNTIYFFFPGELLYDEPLLYDYLKGTRLKLDIPRPTRDELKNIFNKYKDLPLETSRDFGVTLKDYKSR